MTDFLLRPLKAGGAKSVYATPNEEQIILPDEITPTCDMKKVPQVKFNPVSDMISHASQGRLNYPSKKEG